MCIRDSFTDVRMRQAVAYAINKEEALEVCGSGMGQVVIYPCDLGDRVTANPDYVPETTYEYNVEKAKALVEECGNAVSYTHLDVYKRQVDNHAGTAIDNLTVMVCGAVSTATLMIP